MRMTIRTSSQQGVCHNMETVFMISVIFIVSLWIFEEGVYNGQDKA